MNVIQIEGDSATVTFTRNELGTLGNALNEVCDCVEEWEFQTRIGVTRREVEELMQEISNVFKHQT